MFPSDKRKTIMENSYKKAIVLFISLLVISVTAKAFNIPDKQSKAISNNQLNLDLIRLKSFTPPKNILVSGTVEPILEETFQFHDLGKIKSIVEAGTFIKGQIFNAKGEVVDSGTLIAQQYTDIDKANLEAAKEAYKKALIDLNNAKSDYVRFKKLFKKHAVSQKSFESAESKYLQRQSDLRDMYQNIIKNEFLLKSDFMFSTFDAEIEKIYQHPDVWYTDFKDTASVRMMNPIAIKIPIKYISDINHLDEKAIIYSPSSNARINNWICDYSEFVDKSYFHYFIVKNEKISFYNNLPKKYESIPKIGWCTKTIKFNENKKNLAVPLSAIQIVNGKEYVWSLTKKNIIDKENAINYRIYIANKVQVQTNDRIKSIGVYKIIELKNSGRLKLNGTIMWDTPPKGLKDNDIVLLDPKKWKLSPGDVIKVLVALLPMKTGFYVPVDSITLNEKNETFVTLKNGKMIKVKVEGGFADLKLISGKGLKEGTLIRQNPNDIQAILNEYYKEILVKKD